MEVQNKLKLFSYKNALISPRKAGLILPLIKKMSIDKALINLKFNDKKASVLWAKLLKSVIGAYSNVDSKNLYVEEAYVGPASTIKTGRVGSRSRFKRILKRRSNLYVKVFLKQEVVKPKKQKVLNTKKK